jgi:hypothetical protein
MKLKRILCPIVRTGQVLLLLLWLVWICQAWFPMPQLMFPVESSFGTPQVKGYVASCELREISGMAAAIQHKGCFWTHNDSGDDSFIYRIDSMGRLRASHHLKGVSAYDWEELAIARLDGVSQPQLFVGDIGDNHARREHISIHILPEPTVANSGQISRRQIATLKLTYANGARDAEAMLIDAVHNELIIITKREQKSGIYSTPLLPLQNRSAFLTFRGELPFRMVTAASLSPDRMEAVIRNYKQIFYWKRRNLQQPLVELLQTQPHSIACLPELQGEAIAWANDGSGFYTATESPIFMGSPLVFYGR